MCRWNCLDFTLTVISVVELFLSGTTAFTVFRALRMARILQLGRRAPRLRKMGAAFCRALRMSVPWFGLLLIFWLIFSILGMQSFGGSNVSAEDPRFSFGSLWETIYTVFIIIIGDSWATIMSITMQQTSWLACFYFLAVFLLGYYMIINLLICILIDAFAYQSAHTEEQEPHEHFLLKHATKVFRRCVGVFGGIRAGECGDCR